MYKSIIAVFLLCCSVIVSESYRYKKPTVLPFGTFKPEIQFRSGGGRYSENGNYKITYERGRDNETLVNCNVYSQGTLLYSCRELPGSGASISNAGYLLVSGTTNEFLQKVTVFNPEGKSLFSKEYKDPDLLNFSSDGFFFGIGTAKALHVVNMKTGSNKNYPQATQFDISADNSLIALADDSCIYVFKSKEQLLKIPHNQFYIRAIKISPDNKKVAFIGQRKLYAYSLSAASLLIEDSVSGSHTFRDIRMDSTTLWAGIHDRDRENRQSKGLLRTYNLQSRSVKTTHEATFQYDPPRKLRYNYGKTRNGRKELPWPFKPFDEPNKQWNGYLQLAASRDGTSGTYCHQGLDMDVPDYERCYSIDSGYVKCKLTIMNPGDLYWRVAVSEVQSADTSDGWLYAHLEKSTIGVDVGDVVLPGDYIGEIIPWSGLSGGHIHFARIRDHGTTWKYNDDQWWNVYSPLENLRPLADNSAPTISDVFPNSKFGIMTNDGDGYVQYLDPNDVSGKVDILVNVREKAWQSQWLQPAYEIKYWLKNLDKDKIHLDTTLGIKRKNTIVGQYSGELYNDLATVMYRVTNQFEAKGWFTPNRQYIHIITNVADTVILNSSDITEMKKSALNTALFADGNYRLYVEVYDAAYNATLDSMDMVFNNGVSNSHITIQNKSFYATHEIISGKLKVSYNLTEKTPVSIELFTLSGQLLESKKSATGIIGYHQTEFQTILSPGAYIYRVKADSKQVSEKIIYR